VDAGLDALRFIPNRSARMVEKLIKSARANARIVVSECWFVVCFVGYGRIGSYAETNSAHARGMGFMIKKRFTHITIGLEAPTS